MAIQEGIGNGLLLEAISPGRCRILLYLGEGTAKPTPLTGMPCWERNLRLTTPTTIPFSSTKGAAVAGIQGAEN